MIKVTREDKPTPKKDKYPCLMIGSAGSIILMTSGRAGWGVGTLLEVTDEIDNDQLYKSTDKWPLGEFVVYKGKFVIENV